MFWVEWGPQRCLISQKSYMKGKGRQGGAHLFVSFHLLLFQGWTSIYQDSDVHSGCRIPFPHLLWTQCGFYSFPPTWLVHVTQTLGLLDLPKHTASICSFQTLGSCTSLAPQLRSVQLLLIGTDRCENHRPENKPLETSQYSPSLLTRMWQMHKAAL